MKAAMIEGPHELVVKEIPEPSCGVEEIKIKVEAAALCNATDLHIWEGTFPANLPPPLPARARP